MGSTRFAVKARDASSLKIRAHRDSLLYNSPQEIFKFWARLDIPNMLQPVYRLICRGLHLERCDSHSITSLC